MKTGYSCCYTLPVLNSDCHQSMGAQIESLPPIDHHLPRHIRNMRLLLINYSPDSIQLHCDFPSK